MTEEKNKRAVNIEERVNKAINVLDYAIRNNISAKKASKENGYSETYVKNIKIISKEKFEENILDKKLYNALMNKFEEYYNSKNSKTTTSSDNEKIYRGERLEFNTTGNESSIDWKGDSKNFDKLNNNDNKKPNNDVDYDGYPSNHIKTLDQLLSRCNVDREIWKVENHYVNKWDVTSWKSGKPQTWENFQVKARLKLKENESNAKKAGEIFQKLVNEYEPPLTKIDKKLFENNINNDENNILEVSIFDLHFGKLAWNGETGENFDTKIARKRFIYTIKKLIQRSGSFSIKKILFPIGNDFFNTDNKFNTTSAGTPQDEDLRWQKTFDAGCKLIIDGINILKQNGCTN